MEEHIARQRLIGRLSEELGPSTAEHLVARLVEAAPRQDAIAATLVLLEELAELSGKTFRAAVDALTELQRRNRLSDAAPWLDVGIALAESSGAVALRYFKDSPLVLGLLEEPAVRSQVLGLVLELAEQDGNLALEFLRTSPAAVAALPLDQLNGWLDIGLEITRVDPIPGIEFIRQIPSVATVLPLQEARGWVGFGMKLIAPNSLGKPDYLATLEFLRTSPMILGDIDEARLRPLVVNIGAQLADAAAETAITWLAEAPRLLRMLPSADWRIKVLQYGTLVAERDGQAALAFLRRCPEFIRLLGDKADVQAKFERWFTAGMEVLAYSAEGARAYFALETSKALASVEEALSGVALRQAARTIKLFVQGLCGSDVSIQAVTDSVEPGRQVRAMVTQDGKTIALPALLRRYESYEANMRLYLAMAAHEAGHLEFGTYRLTLSPLADLVALVKARYGEQEQVDPVTLADLFALYPQPVVIRDLWTLLEDARVEFLLGQEYPGLRGDLEQLAREAVTTRSLSHGLTVKELVIDHLLLLTTAGADEFTAPESVADVVQVLWPMCRRVLGPESTAEHVVRVADAVYVRLDELVARRVKSPPGVAEQEPLPDLGAGPSASDTLEQEYRPVTNWAYRGAMNPEFIRDHPPQGVGSEPEGEARGRAESTGAKSEPGRLREPPSSETLAAGRRMPSVVEEWLALDSEGQPPIQRSPQEQRATRYPEWDWEILDYRMNWCRVVERHATAGTADFVEDVLTRHGGLVALLRRYFEGLRPPGLRRVPGQTDGEDVDVDAAVGAFVDLAAGAEASERLYVRREKRERNVAAAILVDVSGSTSRQVDGARRVIDIEKEGLVLLCEALEAVEDQYAVYGYSGDGRNQVDFLIVKDFDEALSGQAAHRLGGLQPSQQNRDGAAIRHAASKLLDRAAKTRLLILISDGRPLDDGYKDDYSLQDTKAALREAREQGIEAVCITVDRDADAYLRRMYGDVRFFVIDRVEALPVRMPRIYQKLTGLQS